MATGYRLASVTAAKVRSEPLGVAARRFGIWGGSLRRSRNLAEGYAVIGAINWQYTADDGLPPSEQFLLGGEYSVRGYMTGLVSGDRGYTVSLELHQLPRDGAALLDGVREFVGAVCARALVRDGNACRYGGSVRSSAPGRSARFP